MGEYTKPLPIPDEDSQPFWEGLRAHKIVLQRCCQCGSYRFPPRSLCPHCLSLESEWREVSGRGKVYSFSVIHHVYRPGFADEVPYVVALIDLEEGIRITSNIVSCTPEEVKIGMDVEAIFADVTPEITLHQFRPSIVSRHS